MSDSDGSPQRDDRHHRRSHSGSLVSPGCVGETLEEREERRLAQAAVPVVPRAGQPRAASADTGLLTRGPEPAEETATAAQAASPAAPPQEGAPGARGAETAAPASRAAAPGAPPARGVAPAQDPGASPGAAAAAEGGGEGARGVETADPTSHATASAGHAAAPGTPRTRQTDPVRATGASPGATAAAAVGREGAKYRAHTNPINTLTSPPKPSPPKPFPPGRTRHVRPPAPERSPPGVTLPQLQRQGDARCVIQEGGDSAQAGQGASHRSAERGTGGDRVVPRYTRRGRARAHAAKSKGAKAGEAPRPAAAEGDRARAADGATRGREPGRDQGTGRARRGASRAPGRAATERMERSEERWASVGAAKGMGTGTRRARAPAVQARARLTGGGTHGTDRGTEAWGPGRDPRARARAPWAPGDRQDAAREHWLRWHMLHGRKRQKVPKIHGLKKHQKNHSLACKKSGRFENTKRTLM